MTQLTVCSRAGVQGRGFRKCWACRVERRDVFLLRDGSRARRSLPRAKHQDRGVTPVVRPLGAALSNARD